MSLVLLINIEKRQQYIGLKRGESVQEGKCGKAAQEVVRQTGRPGVWVPLRLCCRLGHFIALGPGSFSDEVKRGRCGIAQISNSPSIGNLIYSKEFIYSHHVRQGPDNIVMAGKEEKIGEDDCFMITRG